MPLQGLSTETHPPIVLPDLLLVGHLAVVLRRSPSTIRRLIRNGTIPVKRIGSQWVVERHALLAALQPDDLHREALEAAEAVPEAHAASPGRICALAARRRPAARDVAGPSAGVTGVML